MFSGAYQAKKRRREEQERQQNQEIIRKNIAKIIDNCINAVNAGCSMKVEGVLNEVRGCLEQLDLISIDSGDPIASGIIDISEGVDSVADKLLVETKQVLEEIELSEPEFSEKTITMLDEFINTYELLGPNFDPALVNPITFPRDENNLGEHRVLLTTFDLLEGLRKIVEGKGSQARKELMRSIHSGDRPDLQVLLMLDLDKWELVFTEISRLDPRADKQSNDWKKLNRLCKDGFDARFNKLIKKKVVNADEAKCLINELLQIPFIGIQVISNHMLVFGIDFYNNSFYRSFRICEYTIPLRVSDRQVVENFLKSSLKVKCYLEKIVNNFVQIKDRIDRLPNMVGNERSGSSMSISTIF
ncbi:hypothetical protein F8M41_011221 [Gigaspora margarita]|uniref:Uncharacterized protein n=1 Tax=Gigaspora margarita TaxID=4874 RepID=A0A8H4AU02_GIGMA|nr:hypothetical protein F8M41_011221 [Gigaspora margarita]